MKNLGIEIAKNVLLEKYPKEVQTIVSCVNALKDQGLISKEGLDKFYKPVQSTSNNTPSTSQIEFNIVSLFKKELKMYLEESEIKSIIDEVIGKLKADENNNENEDSNTADDNIDLTDQQLFEELEFGN